MAAVVRGRKRRKGRSRPQTFFRGLEIGYQSSKTSREPYDRSRSARCCLNSPFFPWRGATSSSSKRPRRCASFNPRSSPRRGATTPSATPPRPSGRFNPRSSPRRGATTWRRSCAAMQRGFNPRSSPRRGATYTAWGPVTAMQFQPALLSAERSDRADLSRRVRSLPVSTRAPLRGEERPTARAEAGCTASFNPRSSPRRGATVVEHGYDAAVAFQPALLSAERSDVQGVGHLHAVVGGFNPRSSPRRGATSRCPLCGSPTERFQPALLSAERSDALDDRTVRTGGVVSTRAPLRGEERRRPAPPRSSGGGCFNPRSSPRRGATFSWPEGG